MERSIAIESQLSKKCKACPYVDTCDHKCMEAMACMLPDDPDKMNIAATAASPIVSDILEPLAVKHDYRDIKIAEGTTVTIDLEDIKKKMVEDFYRGVFMSGC